MVSRDTHNFQIIEYQQEYADRIIKVIDTVLKDIGTIPKSDELIDDEDLQHIGKIYTGRGRFWIALFNNKIIGTVAIREIDHNTAKLNRMFVLTDYHGTGIGQELLAKAVTFARSQNYKKIVLNTHKTMHRAHKFYENNGFQRVGEDNDKYHYTLSI